MTANQLAPTGLSAFSPQATGQAPAASYAAAKRKSRPPCTAEGGTAADIASPSGDRQQ